MLRFPGTTELLASGVGRGTVVQMDEDGIATVLCDGVEPSLRLCAVLQTSPEQSLRLTRDDRVLVWLPERVKEHGVVLGCIGSPATSREPAARVDNDCPDELVLEAKHTLTLRVGDGSITIREDGKILIKGKDLVSHAARTNRIKGGSVQIN